MDLRLTRAALFAAVCVVLAAAGHTLASGGRTIPLWALAAGWFAVFALVVPMAGRERSWAGIWVTLLGGQLVLHSLFGHGLFNPGHGHGASAPPGPGTMEALAGRLLCGPSTGHGALTGGAMTMSGGPMSGGTMTMPDGTTMAASAHAEQIVRGAGLAPDGITGAAYGHSGLAALPGSALPMLLGHLAAALVAGWLLWRGERALWRLVGLAERAAVEVSDGPVFALRNAIILLKALRKGLSACPTPPGGAGTADTCEPPFTGCSVLLLHCVIRRGPPGAVLAT